MNNEETLIESNEQDTTEEQLTVEVPTEIRAGFRYNCSCGCYEQN
jgi:hypothetical protein